MTVFEKSPRIITFYSYKGGTGRTMALSNVAWLLASNGAKVLAIDWDLEAPGLHKYFFPFINDSDLSQSDGLIDLLSLYVEHLALTSDDMPPFTNNPLELADPRLISIPIEFDFPHMGALHIIGAGKQESGYPERIRGFDWPSFYERFGGSAFVEEFAKNCRDHYDFILIDSRTGVADTSGICTIQMPDEVVLCYTYNRQSIEGIAAVARSIIAKRQDIILYPIATRVVKDVVGIDKARTFAIKHLSSFVSESQLQSSETSYWSSAEVPHYPTYGFEELLAAFVETAGGRNNLLADMEWLTTCLANKSGLSVKQPEIPHSIREQYFRIVRFHDPEKAWIEGILEKPAAIALEAILNRVESLDPRRLEPSVVLDYVTAMHDVSNRLLSNGELRLAEAAAKAAGELVRFSDSSVAIAKIDELHRKLVAVGSGTGIERVFISYSRGDGANAARALRELLQKQEVSVWQDLVALESGLDWWRQIENAIRSPTLQHLLLIVTPLALKSSITRAEIRLARQEGKAVHLVKGPGLDDLSTLPRWFGQVCDLELVEHRDTLIRILKLPSQQKRVAMMAPEPPPDFVARPNEFKALKSRLLDYKQDAVVGITAALKGAGGYGKTTLAKALAHDAEIQDAFFDGILWVELGEQPGNILSIVADLVEKMTGERPGFETITAARAALTEALGDRRILLIIDDVWRKQDLDPFLQGGPYTTRLITTRINHVLPSDAVREQVDAMRDEEAFCLLAWGLDETEVFSQEAELKSLVTRLGEWALLLKLVNGFMRENTSAGQSVGDAIAEANLYLDEEGLTAFDNNDAEERTKAVAQTIAVSLRLLPEIYKKCFGELDVFPEDADIPIKIVERLWAKSAGLNKLKTGRLLKKLYSLSLLLNLDLDRRILRFHDTIRHYLQQAARQDTLTTQHQQLIDAMGGMAEMKNATDVERQYFYRHLPHHLDAAGDLKTLRDLMVDPAWLDAKLRVLKNPQSLVADFLAHADPGNQTTTLLRQSLELISGLLARDERQLLPQLVARLKARHLQTEPRIQEFAERAQALIASPAFLPKPNSLKAGGGPETLRLEGHTAPVTKLAVLADGCLASSSDDNTVRLWDTTTGQCQVLKGHTAAVTTLAVLPDGRLASGSHDNTVRLWDTTTGQCQVLEGHSGRVTTLVMLPDGRLASGSNDNTVRMWDTATGQCQVLEGHSDSITTLAVLPDGCLASGSLDTTVRLWDTATGQAQALKGHSNWVSTLTVLPDGRLASGSYDNIIRLWDPAIGQPWVFEGHSSWVSTIAVLPDGRLASASDDNTVRLWDVASGQSQVLKGYSGEIGTLAVLPDGRLASGSNDDTVRVWDTNTGQVQVLKGHSDWVKTLAVLPDGRLASGSDDNTVRLWDTATGKAQILEGHSNWVRTFAVLTDGRLASGSSDNTVRLWDPATGQAQVLKGHSGWVNTLAVLNDGRLASGSHDNTVRLWDPATGQTQVLKGHSGSIRTLAVLTDGRLASGSSDNTVRLWNLATGKAQVLEGHLSWINTLAVLADGHLASGSYDNTVRLWDLATGHGRVLEGHLSEISTLAVLPDGRLASGSHDNTVRLWDTATGQAHVLEGHSGSVSALTALADGRLASGSYDNTVRLWDLASGKEIARIEVDASLSILIALPDGRLVTGDVSGAIQWLEII